MLIILHSFQCFIFYWMLVHYFLLLALFIRRIIEIFLQDRDVKIPGSSGRGEKDEEFSGRIRDFEDKLREQAPQEKKPKDLLRAIGKIETTDWNVKEIEKKINENKLGKSVNKEKEKVPKWSREQV